MKRNVVAIIQARMSSTRLPNKVLMKINDHSMLEEVIRRTRRIRDINEVIVATTKNPKDQQIVSFCKKLKTKVFRGSEDDILDRFYHCAKVEKANVVIRITSDCPLLDSKIVEEGLELFLTTDADYVSNALERTYPRGLDFEIFTFAALERAWRKAKSRTDREHVTSYFYSHPEIFKIQQLLNKTDYSKYRLTVDTQIDLELIRTIFKALGKRESIFNFEKIIQFLEKNKKVFQILWQTPILRRINSHNVMVQD